MPDILQEINTSSELIYTVQKHIALLESTKTITKELNFIRTRMVFTAVVESFQDRLIEINEKLESSDAKTKKTIYALLNDYTDKLKDSDPEISEEHINENLYVESALTKEEIVNTYNSRRGALHKELKETISTVEKNIYPNEKEKEVNEAAVLIYDNLLGTGEVVTNSKINATAIGVTNIISSLYKQEKGTELSKAQKRYLYTEAKNFIIEVTENNNNNISNFSQLLIATRKFIYKVTHRLGIYKPVNLMNTRIKDEFSERIKHITSEYNLQPVKENNNITNTKTKENILGNDKNIALN